MTNHDIAKSLNCGTQVHMAILDFSKAFDKVSHGHLSHKLEYYGITGIGLIPFYLIDQSSDKHSF